MTFNPTTCSKLPRRCWPPSGRWIRSAATPISNCCTSSTAWRWRPYAMRRERRCLSRPARSSPTSPQIRRRSNAMRLADRASALLAPGGPISRAMSGFEPRAAQVQMARAVADTLEEGGVLLVEAPTGSGKGLAYLAALAAYLSRRPEFKAVASTATITLQEQLIRKDLPVITDAVGGLPAALLKGMGRYLCLLKWRGLSRSEEHTSELQSRLHLVCRLLLEKKNK